jgi:hypothetical protein
MRRSVSRKKNVELKNLQYDFHPTSVCLPE